MPIAKKKDVTQDFLNQMKSNLTINSSDTEPGELKQVEIKTDAPNKKNETTYEKTAKYADVMNIRLSKGRRNEIKVFCANCGITITQYIESSFEFLAKEVSAGNIVISKGGISKIEKQ